MSIATKTGDNGETALAGGTRVSKADLRVEAYGTVDELNSFLGFARSICNHQDIFNWTEEIQRTLFRVGAVLASPPEKKLTVEIAAADVEHLTSLVQQVEATDGILSDWSVAGAHTGSAAYEVARTVCRRAERHVVRLAESGASVPSTLIAYLNRLSDLLWLFGRLLEKEAGIDSRLRGEDKAGPQWSRAW